MNAICTAPSGASAAPDIRTAQALVLREREAVGHAGDVVRDRAGLAVLREARAHVLREPGRLGAEGAEEIAEHALGLLRHAEDLGMMVEVPVEEVLELDASLL